MWSDICGLPPHRDRIRLSVFSGTDAEGGTAKGLFPEGCELESVEAENAKDEIRNAISLIFDRNYIVEEIGQAGQVPASSFVAMGMTSPDGTHFYQTAASERL